jgi:ligand-binding SRPBCC domain-containing protein
VPTIELETRIAAPVERVFDLCRSIEAHTESTSRSDERAIGGRTSGLIGLGEHVTWSARHFGIRWRLTSRIVALDRPRHFRDSMVEGVFARLHHDHWFHPDGDGTRAVDRFDYTSPLGLLGRLADALAVRRHLERFLEERMQTIRRIAESDAWRRYLPTA